MSAGPSVLQSKGYYHFSFIVRWSQRRILAQKLPGHRPQSASSAHRHNVEVFEPNAAASLAVVGVDGGLEKALDFPARLQTLDRPVSAQSDDRDEIAGGDPKATERAECLHEVIEEPGDLGGQRDGRVRPALPHDPSPCSHRV